MWLVGILLSPLVPLSGEAAGWWACNGIAYDQEIRIARSKGEPVTLEEMEAFYPTSPEIERTTKFWLEAIAEARAADDTARKSLPFAGVAEPEVDAQGNLTGAQLTKAEAWLAKRSDEFKLVREARRAGAVARYPAEFEKLIWANNDYLKGLRLVAGDLSLAAEVHLSRGDTNAAVDDVLSILATAESLRNEPLLLPQLVRIALVGMGWEATKGILDRGSATDVQLHTLQRAWAAMEFLESNRRSLIGERFTLERLTIDPPPEAGRDGNVMRRRWASRIDAGQSMAFFRRLIDGTTGDFHQAQEAYGDFEVAIENFMVRKQPFLIYLYINTAMQLPALQVGFSASCRAQSEAALAETSLACERFRRAEGRWPQTLAELVPQYLAEVPLDAQGDDRLSYRPDGDDAIVYSFGFDQKDDGGRGHSTFSRNGREVEDRSTYDMIYRLTDKTTRD
ncbi:MAG TPA: hypothetical protein VGN57_05200 [Pirellulaceae bacterium]|nr:hypothetical protein [Pirellulaceae bacterium]